MSEKKKVTPWADCCTDWGNYMEAKKAKLEEQFQEKAKIECPNASTLFNGIAIFVNGYTNPSSDELKRIMMLHGGTYHHYLRSSSTTHMIASNLPYSKIIAYRKAKNPLPLCKPEWITDSIKAEKLLDYRKYLLYSHCTNTKPLIFAQLSNKVNVTSTEKAISNCTEIGNFIAQQNVDSKLKSNEKKTSPLLQETSHTNKSSIVANCTKNPEFLNEFYNNSRLHHIATMGAIFKDYINDLRDKSNRNFPGLDALKKEASKKFPKAGSSTQMYDKDLLINNQYLSNITKTQLPLMEKKQIIMHIDMDCFFVSVGLRDHPELRGFPIAVAHAKGNAQKTPNDNQNSNECGSMSEVASCSYEARKVGVKNGMLLGQALKLCPNLKTIRYNFDGYKEVSCTLYDTIASYTLDIEAVSCDEMYVDCTKILQISGLQPLDFASIIRKEINEKTGCPVSTGFGENKLQARLATRKAKPNGQFYLKQDCVKSFIRALSVRDLPGVGYATSQKLHQMNVETCADLELISLYELQNEFGKKNGQQMYDMSRGIDNSKLNLEHIRKSVSAEVNYGIRFENSEAAHEFLKKLSIEISDRLKKVNLKGKNIILKGMFRAKEAPNEPKKFMGHGLCDVINKSKSLLTATDDPVIITREVIHLWNQFNQNCADARGIGIQINKLEAKHKCSNSTLLKFIDRTKGQNKIDNASDNAVNLNINKQNELKLKNENVQRTHANEDERISINKNPSSHGENQIAESKESPLYDIIPTDYDYLNNIENKDETESKFLKNDRSKRSSQLKQTKQSEYFKQIKRNNREGKVKLPDIKEIDMKVLIELPEDIRNEILNEYKRNDTALDKCDNNEQRSNNENQNNPVITTNKDFSFSQVDPDYLAALPDDIKEEIKLYYDEQKREKNACSEAKRANSKADKGWNMFKNEKISKKNEKLKFSKLKIKKVGKKQKDPSSCKSKLVEIPESRMTEQVAEKATVAKDINNSIRFDLSNENSEYSKMLSKIVNCLLDLPIKQVKLQIIQWVHNHSDVNYVDFLSIMTYLGILPKKRRIEDLFILLKCLNRIITDSKSCVWHETYRKMLEHIQARMRLVYKYNMMIPDQIDCDKCMIVQN